MIPDQMGRVPPELLPFVWPQIVGRVRRALSRFDLYTSEQVHDLVEAGNWELWAATVGRRVVAFGMCEVADFPRPRRVLVIHLSGGDSVEAHNALWPLIKAYAKAQGCSRAISDPRRGWFRAGKLPSDWQHVTDTALAEID